MTNHPAQKSFVESNDEATIVCPQCNNARSVAVLQFRQRLHMLKVKCRCGHTFKVQLEFRRHYRKTTNMEGIYESLPPSVSGGKAKVINLSQSGAYFELHGTHDLKVGQKGTLVFTLDDRKNSEITKSVYIQSVNGNRIGCEFVEDRAFDKELGFYLRP